MERSTTLLLGAPFLLSIALLLVNDAVLKPALHNWLTGKLSDVAGLFVLPVLVVAITGWRPRVVCWATAIAFVVWKSPLATPLIAAWNASVPWHLARVIDYSDWVALVAVVLANLYIAARRASAERSARPLARSSVAVAVAGVAVVVADSRRIPPQPIPDGAAVELPASRAAVMAQLDRIGFEHTPILYRRAGDLTSFTVDTVELWRRESTGDDVWLVELKAAPESRSVLRLVGAWATRDSSWAARARATFEHDVGQPLQRRFDVPGSLVAGDVYHLRTIDGAAPAVFAPDSDCGGWITSAELEVRHTDTLVVSVKRRGTKEGCVWRSYARLVRHAHDSTATYDDDDSGIHGEGLLFGEWRVIALDRDLYLERVQGRPLLGVGSDLAFGR